MSLHASILMIRADVRDQMAEIFSSFDYRPISSHQAATFNEMLAALEYPRHDKSADVVHKAVALLSGWTVIFDDEMIMLAEEHACSDLSARVGQPLFGMLCEGTSGSYAFSLFNPDLRRAFWSSDRKIVDNRGAPIPEEEGIDLEAIFEDDVLKIMERFGVEYGALEQAGPFVVWELDESHIGGSTPAQQPEIVTASKTKPWWKLW